MSEFERQQHDVCVVTGDTWLETIEFQDSDGDPIDLSGRTPTIQVRSTATADSVSLELTAGDGLTFTAASGLIEVSVDVDIDAGDYVWELELGGTITSSPLWGNFKVIQDITR